MLFLVDATRSEYARDQLQEIRAFSSPWGAGITHCPFPFSFSLSHSLSLSRLFSLSFFLSLTCELFFFLDLFPSLSFTSTRTCVSLTAMYLPLSHLHFLSIFRSHLCFMFICSLSHLYVSLSRARTSILCLSLAPLSLSFLLELYLSLSLAPLLSTYLSLVHDSFTLETCISHSDPTGSHRALTKSRFRKNP